jgi:hypothetical protein
MPTEVYLSPTRTRELRLGESCVDVFRAGFIPFCSICGAVVVQPRFPTCKFEELGV